MTTLASQITSLTVVYSIVYSDVDGRKHQSSASLAFVRGIHRDRWIPRTALLWRHNGQAGVSNHQPHECLLNRPSMRRSKKTSKLRVTGLCAGNSPETGEFPAQMASNAENVSIWWRHHEGPVTRKMFPFDDVIMKTIAVIYIQWGHSNGIVFIPRTENTSISG